MSGDLSHRTLDAMLLERHCTTQVGYGGQTVLWPHSLSVVVFMHLWDALSLSVDGIYDLLLTHKIKEK